MIFYVLIARDLKCRSLICRPVRVGVVEMDFSATLSGLEIIEKVYVPRKQSRKMKQSVSPIRATTSD
jgi:hypothetical protein